MNAPNREVGLGAAFARARNVLVSAFGTRRLMALAAVCVTLLSSLTAWWLRYDKPVPAAYELEGNSFVDDFEVARRIEESGSPEASSDPNWWLNSGGFLAIDGGAAHSPQGEIPFYNPWRARYAESNPQDTQGGRFPQNLLRMLTRHQWRNTLQEVHFDIQKYHAINSANRVAANGVFLMSRYEDGDNLYYLGLRVDGHAVIKKKRNGTYYTLAYEALDLPVSYDRDTDPIVLPTQTWHHIRAITQDTDKGVLLELYLFRQGKWELVAEALDTGVVGGPIIPMGRAGLRSDFMDVSFDRYAVHELGP